MHVDCDRDMDGQLTLDEFTSAIATYYKEHAPGQFDAAVSAPKKKRRGLFGRRSTSKGAASATATATATATTTDDAPYKEKEAKKTGLLGRMGKRRKAKAAMNYKAKGEDLSTAEFIAIMNADSDDDSEADPFVNALNGPPANAPPADNGHEDNGIVVGGGIGPVGSGGGAAAPKRGKRRSRDIPKTTRPPPRARGESRDFDG